MEAISNLPVNLFDIGVIAVLLISSLFAYARGFVHEVFAVIGWIGAILATFYGFPYLILYSRQLIPMPLAADIATGALIFICTLVLLSIITKTISRKVKKSDLNALDRSLGFLFGLVRGALIIVLAYIALELIMPKNNHPAFILSSRSVGLIKSASQELIELLPVPQNSAPSGLNQSSVPEAGKVVLDIISPSLESQSSTNEHTRGYGLGPRQDMDRLIRTTQE